MRIDKNHWLINTFIAHRGLHDGDAAENSLAAFRLAEKKGYAIELDVRFSKDGQVVVFHDDTLSRMTGEKGLVIDKTYKELKELDLIGGGKIPLLKDALGLINASVPFLIEIKDQPERNDLVSATIDILKNYKGEYAYQSFNPFYVGKIKKLAPHIMRGQLATKYPSGHNALTSYILRHFYFNAFNKPDFIAFNVNDLPFAPAKRKNTRLITWTVKDAKQMQTAKKYAENIIFEHIDPNLFRQ